MDRGGYGECLNRVPYSPSLCMIVGDCSGERPKDVCLMAGPVLNNEAFIVWFRIVFYVVVLLLGIRVLL